MIVQNVSSAGQTDISFTVPRDDLARTSKVMETIVEDLEASGVSHDADIGRVSIVGAGMKTNPGDRGDDVRGPRPRDRSTSR